MNIFNVISRWWRRSPTPQPMSAAETVDLEQAKKNLNETLDEAKKTQVKANEMLDTVESIVDMMHYDARNKRMQKRHIPSSGSS